MSENLGEATGMVSLPWRWPHLEVEVSGLGVDGVPQSPCLVTSGDILSFSTWWLSCSATMLVSLLEASAILDATASSIIFLSGPLAHAGLTPTAKSGLGLVGVMWVLVAGRISFFSNPVTGTE